MSEPAALATHSSRVVAGLAWIERHLAHFAALFAAVFLFGTRTQPLRTNWGDPWSDVNIQASGRYFAENGFLRLKFTPICDVGPLKADSLHYTHYPPLPDFINAIQQRLFGPVDISTFRIVADVLALGSLFFFHRIVRSLWGDRTAGYALALLVTNLLWLQYADTIHHVPIYWFTGYAAIYAGVRWLETERRAYLAGVAIAGLFCMMASYDFAFFVPILMAGAIGMKRIRFRDRRSKRLLLALIVGVGAGVVLKLTLVMWAVGAHTMMHDLVFQLEERATAKHSAAYKAGLVPILFWRLVRFFTPVGFAVVAVHLYALGRKLLKKEALAVTAGPLVLLAAGLPFVLVFTQLFVEQYHPTLQLLPYYAVGTAALLVVMRERGGATWNVVAAAVFVFLVGWQMKELASFKKTFLNREDINAVEAKMKGTPDHDFIFTNTLLDFPAARFNLNRYVMGANFSNRVLTIHHLGMMFDATGDDRPIRFLEMTSGVEDMVYDKMVYGLFANEAKWDWISRPDRYRGEWQPLARAMAADSATFFHEVGTLELATDTLRLYRIDHVAFETYRGRATPPGETRAIDFGTPESEPYVAKGIRYAEQGGDGTGFRWTTGTRQPHHLRMTMKGVILIPDGPKYYESVIRLRVAPVRDRRLTLKVLSFVPGERLDVSVNGHPVGSAPVGEPWSDVSFLIPAEALLGDSLQWIQLRTAKGSEHGFGVALSSARIDDP